MGGFVDPFIPPPAWPQDLVFTGSSWSANASASLADSAGTYLGAALDQGTEFHLQNSSSPSLLNGSAKEILSPVQLHEQFLEAQLQDDVTQGLNFEVDGALMASTLGSVLSTPCAISLADSAPVVCSSNDSSGSEQSGLPQFLLGDQPVPAPAVWASTFMQISSLVGEETSQSFGFGAVSTDHLLREACDADGKKYPQPGIMPSAQLQLHNNAEFNNGTGKMLSFAPGPGQQANTNFEDLQMSQKEFTGLHHLNLSSLVSGQLSSFNATGVAHNPKQSNEVSSKNGLNAAPLMPQSEVPNGSGIAGNGAPKPRVRARRGQATDPHSIAERLRREKISDRMKNLQELVPNSNRTDKASMLDEIIDYVKFLQLQVKVLSMSRLGATEAVVPLLTESQTESSSGGLLLSPRSGTQPAGSASLLGQSSELRDGAAFEQEVVQLMENNMTTAMQYLQSKGLCLMPIALASAISDQKGTSSAAVRPMNGGAADEDDGAGGEKHDANEMLRGMKAFGSAREMRSRA